MGDRETVAHGDGEARTLPLVSHPGEIHTATFLMTDIAGSTRLWEEQRDAMILALATHDQLLRTAVEDAGGTVVKTTGDGLLAAFERPGAAVRAAIAGQVAMAAHGWPTAQPIRSRMAIHAGEAEVRDHDYFGPALNRVARLLAIGHGGQVLVSSAGAALAGGGLPPGASLLDRGEHHLRDIARAEHVYQLAAPGLDTAFPALRTGDAPTNLPADLTSFIGRERETTEVRGLLRTHRLVTLVGVGGTGKTRLTLHIAGEVASQHADGTWLVELAPLREPVLVVEEVVRAVGLQLVPGQPAIAALTDYLRGKDLLLLLDNCEHLIEAAAELVERLLAGCPSLQVLATSREALGVLGEAAYAVPSMSLPERLGGEAQLDLAAVASYESVRLFVERATTTLPSFRLDQTTAAPVVEICRRLDGIPLALELAAARVNVLSATEIAEGLGDRFRLLTGGRRTAVPRQQTLLALIDWSWDLLAQTDQQLVRRLSVFAGGWTLDAAAAVVGDQSDAAAGPTAAARLDTLDGLGRLVDRSLVVAVHGEATRYGMLETIRQYANDKLVAASEAADLRARHVARYRGLALDAAGGLLGPDMLLWLGRIEAELDNLRAALDWAFETDPQTALEMSVALVSYWRSRSLGSEGVDRMRQAVELARRWRAAPSEVPDATRAVLEARAMVGAFSMVGSAGWGMAGAIAQETLDVSRESGDPAAIADALVVAIQIEVMTRGGRNTDELRAAGREALALATEADDPARQSTIQTALAMIEAREDPAAAEGWLEQAMAAARRTGNPAMIAGSLQMRGRVASRAGRHAEAVEWFARARADYDAIGDARFAASAASERAHSLRRAGEIAEADAEYRRTIRVWHQTGNRGAVANQLESLALTATAIGDGVRAARLLGAAELLREASGDPMTEPEREEYDVGVAALKGQLAPAELEAAWGEGRGMTAAAAIGYAVGG